MRIGRTLPPAAAPISLTDILNGLRGGLEGPHEINRFIAELKAYFNVSHCFLVSSGKVALTLILRALKYDSPDRNEVLIPAFTCYSLPSAIVRAGLKVRLCDIDPRTLDFDESLSRHLENPKNLLAVVCPHLFGLTADIGRIREIIKDEKVTVIDDAAQVMGGIEENDFLGTKGDVGFFSLGRGKALSTVEGGIIVSDSDQIGRRIESLIQKIPVQPGMHQAKLFVYALVLNVLIPPALFWLPKSIPGLRLGETVYDPGFPVGRFSSFQAGLARNWQGRVKFLQQIRRQNVCYWLETLKRFTWMRPVYIKKEPDKVPPMLRLPVMLQDADLRDALLEASEEKGLGIMPSYPDAIDGIKQLEIVNKAGAFSGAKECANRLLTFPVHGYIRQKDRERIIECLEDIDQKVT